MHLMEWVSTVKGKTYAMHIDLIQTVLRACARSKAIFSTPVRG